MTSLTSIGADFLRPPLLRFRRQRTPRSRRFHRNASLHEVSDEVTAVSILLNWVAQKDEAELALAKCTMAVFVIRGKKDTLQAPYDIGIVIEGGRN
ncbi:hypothetical protein CHARACLAT_018144 [Characodon lateralis]|uniref:Uncharacterized protein n=1 Tax=Characodon lateralis TaxID=208331 RepID=A0ABU7F583_9TELE|nr:hypothetical protein [Characodon lateralis]